MNNVKIHQIFLFADYSSSLLGLMLILLGRNIIILGTSSIYIGKFFFDFNYEYYFPRMLVMRLT